MNLHEITEGLGRPASQGDGWAIYNGDCLELLARIPKGTIPLTVTSPPYNIGKSYETVRRIEEYLDWCEEWINRIHHATADDGAFWLNLGYLSLSRRAKWVPCAEPAVEIAYCQELGKPSLSKNARFRSFAELSNWSYDITVT